MAEMLYKETFGFQAEKGKLHFVIIWICNVQYIWVKLI